MKIDYSLYPKHNWQEDITCIDLGFYTLVCQDCNYMIRERFVGDCYVSDQLDYDSIGDRNVYYFEDISPVLARQKLHSCDELIIKKLLE
jgi:hypothetical protein